MSSEKKIKDYIWKENIQGYARASVILLIVIACIAFLIHIFSPERTYTYVGSFEGSIVGYAPTPPAYFRGNITQPCLVLGVDGEEHQVKIPSKGLPLIGEIVIVEQYEVDQFPGTYKYNFIEYKTRFDVSRRPKLNN